MTIKVDIFDASSHHSSRSTHAKLNVREDLGLKFGKDADAWPRHGPIFIMFIEKLKIEKATYGINIVAIRARGVQKNHLEAKKHDQPQIERPELFSFPLLSSKPAALPVSLV